MGVQWMDAAVMTSAKSDEFVLSNLCHLGPPMQQPVLNTRAGEAEPEKINLGHNSEPSTDREAPPVLLPALGAHKAAPAPGMSWGVRGRGDGSAPSGWHAMNYGLALHPAIH